MTEKSRESLSITNRTLIPPEVDQQIFQRIAKCQLRTTSVLNGTPNQDDDSFFDIIISGLKSIGVEMKNGIIPACSLINEDGSFNEQKFEVLQEMGQRLEEIAVDRERNLRNDELNEDEKASVIECARMGFPAIQCMKTSELQAFAAYFRLNPDTQAVCLPLQLAPKFYSRETHYEGDYHPSFTDPDPLEELRDIPAKAINLSQNQQFGPYIFSRLFTQGSVSEQAPSNLAQHITSLDLTDCTCMKGHGWFKTFSRKLGRKIDVNKEKYEFLQGEGNISHLRNCLHLRHLKLGRNVINIKLLAGLARHAPALESLDLRDVVHKSRMRTTTEGFRDEHLSAVSQLPIRSLQLNSYHINSSGKLTELLQSESNFPRLEILDARGCDWVSPSRIHQIKHRRELIVITSPDFRNVHTSKVKRERPFQFGEQKAFMDRKEAEHREIWNN